ncbi:MAG: hypothetical protein ACT4NY_24980 [Pseudonocardiales bacterium]
MPALGSADDLVTDVGVDVLGQVLVVEPEAESIGGNAVEGFG